MQSESVKRSQLSAGRLHPSPNLTAALRVLLCKLLSSAAHRTAEFCPRRCFVPERSQSALRVNTSPLTDRVVRSGLRVLYGPCTKVHT